MFLRPDRACLIESSVRKVHEKLPHQRATTLSLPATITSLPEKAVELQGPAKSPHSLPQPTTANTTVYASSPPVARLSGTPSITPAHTQPCNHEQQWRSGARARPR